MVTMNIQGCAAAIRAHEGDDGARPRGVSRGGQSRDVSRADSRRPASVAGEEAVLLRGIWGDRGGGPRREARRAGGAGTAGEQGASAPARTSPGSDTAVYDEAARPDLRGDRRRRAQLSHVSGNVGDAGAARLRDRPRRRRRAADAVSAGRLDAAGADADRIETSIFDGIDLSLSSLAAKFAGANPPEQPGPPRIAAIVQQAQSAKKAFDAGDDAGTAAPIEAGSPAVRALRGQLATIEITDAARFEISASGFRAERARLRGCGPSPRTASRSTLRRWTAW